MLPAELIDLLTPARGQNELDMPPLSGRGNDQRP